MDRLARLVIVRVRRGVGAAVVAVTLAVASSCMTQPLQNASFPSIASTITFGGFHHQPGADIELQFYSQVFGVWSQLTVVESSSTPFVTDSQGITWYSWSATAAVPSNGWIDDPLDPGKAVAQVRASDGTYPLSVHDGDLYSCAEAQNHVGLSIIANCRSDYDPYVLHVRAPSSCPAGQSLWAGFCVPDGDGDHVADFEDNCPETPNPDQADGDGNGVGDACPFEYPLANQEIVYEEDYLFRAESIPGATAYLVGLVQNGVEVYENARDEASFSQEIDIPRGSALRIPIKPYVPTLLFVRGLVNGQWTPEAYLPITFVPRKRTIKVLEVRYFPVTGENEDLLDPIETGVSNPSYTLAQIQSRTQMLTETLVERLSDASAHENRYPGKDPYLTYEILTTVERRQKVPRGTNPADRPDHRAILDNLGICGYVDEDGVREVWLWAYQNKDEPPPLKLELIESNMAMGTESTAFFTHGTYGDVSNSGLLNDLPVCQHTYTVFNFEYELHAQYAIHSYGHQRERLMKFADQTLFGSFESPYGTPGSATRGCGNVHYPPNAPVCGSATACACDGVPGALCQDYWQVQQSVPSRCNDWQPNGGAVATTNCTAWGCLGGTNYDHDAEAFHVWWAQRMPGRGTALAYNGKRMRNWHELTADFDLAMDDGKRLTE